jgi:cytosine/adenosine deaminase-related metal-dependent hydrolase
MHCKYRLGVVSMICVVTEAQSPLIKPVDDEATNGMADARDQHADKMSVESALKAHQTHHGSSDGRVQIWFGVVTPRGVSIEKFAAIGRVARSKDIGITMHCAEAPADNPIYHDKYSCSPLEFVEKAQLAGAKTVLAHVVHPDAEPDFAIMKETQTTVSHNPSSNCKLGSGISPIPDMLASGVNVALGTDGAPCNNTYDMIREMHLASIIHSGARQTAGVLNAYTALEMATINGARALGMEASIGSLEAGKKADFVLVNPASLDCAPWTETHSADACDGGMDPVTVLVHSCTGQNVERVVVNGKTVVEAGELQTADEASIVKCAQRAAAEVRKRGAVRARNHFSLRYI